MLASKFRIVSVFPVPGGPSMTETERVRAFSTAARWLRLQRKGKIGAISRGRDSIGEPARKELSALSG
jgi:hypothetical protein